ncbi:MAG: DUF4238 domain-containing protein [Thermodesulfobacteriota bacterium]
MPQPRKHHYLPQFYLRGFSPDGNSVHQIEKPSLRSYVCSIRDAAAIRDYHELDYAHSEDSNGLEKELAKIESNLAVTLRHVVDYGIDSTNIFSELIQLVSLMRVRIPAYKKFIEDSLRQQVRSTGMILERSGALPPVPKGYEDELRMDKLVISISNWICLYFMFRLAGDPAILGMLASMKPSVLHAPDGESFLTCDQPVAVYNPDASPSDPFGTGPADSHSEISLPLSSRALLHLTWDKRGPRERILSSSEVEEFNRRTIVMADSLIFASESNEATNALVARYAHCSANHEVEVLNRGKGYLHVARFRPVMAPNRYPKSPTGPSPSPIKNK